MATEQDGFLAMIEAKIAALQVLAESYRAAISVRRAGPSGRAGFAGSCSCGGCSGRPPERRDTRRFTSRRVSGQEHP